VVRLGNALEMSAMAPHGGITPLDAEVLGA
jgi:hypothetical protein